MADANMASLTQPCRKDTYPGHSKPALPGETILLYATGFGLPSNQLVQGSASQSGPLPTLPSCTMDAVRPVTVVGANVVSPGLYQVNVTVPPGMVPGDHLFSCSHNGFVTNADGPTLIAVGPTSPPSGFVPGSIFQITGTLAMNGRTLNVEMDVQAQGFNNLYSVTFDDNASASSGVTMDFFMLQTAPLVSGNTFSISGLTTSSQYQDTTAGPQPVGTISPVRINLYFDSFDKGSAVTGTYVLTTSTAGALRGTFTGTVASIL